MPSSPPDSRPPAAPPAPLRLGAVIVSTVLALVFAEWLLAGPLRPEVASTRDAAWQARLADMHRALYESDPELVYRPRPGARFPMDYGAAAFNGQGLREPAETALVPTAAHRVAVLGDSLVWGELLAQEDALPAVLGRAQGPGVEVLNAGVTGFGTEQERLWYRRALRPLHPDTVVLVFCLNDFLIQSGPYGQHGDAARLRAQAEERAWLDAVAPIRNETVSRRWLEERRGSGNQLAAALRHLLRWHRLFSLPGGYTDELLISAAEPGRQAGVAAALTGLGADLAEDGVNAVLVISPALYWWHRYQWTGVHRWVRSTAAAAGFRVIDPLDSWRGMDPDSFRFPGDNLHYSAKGVRELVKVLAPHLASLPPPARPAARPASTPPAG